MPVYVVADEQYEAIRADEVPEQIQSFKEMYGDPTFGEYTKAAFRRDNSLFSAASMIASSPGSFKPVPGYDPYAEDNADIKGYEMFARNFMDSKSPEETAYIKSRIDQEYEDRRTLEAVGWKGFAAEMAAGAVDPIYLLLMGGGSGIAIGKETLKGGGKQILKAAGKASAFGFIGEVLAEGAKQATQETRSLEESLVNIGGATFLSGVFGGTMGGLSARKFKKLSNDLDNVFGAEAWDVTANGNIKISANNLDLVNAGKIEQFKVSPILRTALSDSDQTKMVANQMMETPLVTKGNIEGISAAPQGGSVETRIKAYDYPLAESLEYMEDAYTHYRQGKGPIKRMVNDYVMRNRAGKLSFQEFREAVGKAMRRNDFSDIPEVQNTAKHFRKYVIDPLKNGAIDAELLPPGIDIQTAATYLSRIYNTKKIIAERDAWSQIVGDWFRGIREEDLIRKPTSKWAKMTDDEIRNAVNEVTEKILGNSAGRAPYEAIQFSRGPLKARTFSIPDELIEDFLESDIDIISRYYTRTMASDVELTKMFGSVDMADQLDAITKEWNGRIETAKNAKERKKMQKRKEGDLRDIQAMRDRLRGTYRSPADPNNFFVRTGRFIRDVNFLRMLGGMTISAIPDIARPVAVNGLRPVGKALVALAKSPAKFKLAVEEARKAAIGLDMVLNTRAFSIADIADVYGRHTRFERATRKASDVFAKITFMSQWNAAMKQFSGVVTADRFLVEALNWEAGKISKNAMRRMAQAGIDKEMAVKIAKQFKKYGEEGTLKLAQADKWDDALTMETFRNAILKDVDRTIVTPGKGEAPLWTSSEFGKMVYQFKSFAGSAHHKILLADLQHRDGAALSGFLLSVGLGTLTYGLKNYVAGREISTEPDKVIVESLDRSGAFGYLWDANNIVEKWSRGNIGINPLLGGAPMSRYASRNALGAVLGPSVGTVQDLAQITGAFATGEMSKSDIRAIRKMIPGQNLFYVRQLLNALEEKVAEGVVEDDYYSLPGS